MFFRCNFNDLACDSRCFTWFSSHSPAHTDHSHRCSESALQAVKRCRSAVMRASSSRMRHIYTEGMRLPPLLLGGMPARGVFLWLFSQPQKDRLMVVWFCVRRVSFFFCLFLASERHRNGIDPQATESGERRPVLGVEERFRSNWLCSNTSCKSACCWLRMRLLQAGIARQGESSDTGH